MRLLWFVALFWSGLADAGYLHGGYCYVDAAAAARAWCNDLAREVVVSGDAAVAHSQFSLTQGAVDVVRTAVLAYPYCASTVVSPMSPGGVTVGLTATVQGISLGSAQSVAGAGVTYPSLSVGAVAGSPSTYSRGLNFPSCTVSQFASSTAADGVEAGFLAGGALVVVAAMLFLGRRVLT